MMKNNQILNTLPLGILDLREEVFQENFPIQVVLIGETEGELEFLWKQYLDSPEEHIKIEVFEKWCPARLVDLNVADPLSLLFLFVVENGFDNPMPWRQLQEILQRFQVVVATIPETWKASTEWQTIQQQYSNKLLCRDWSTLSSTTFTKDQKLVTEGGNDFFDNINSQFYLKRMEHLKEALKIEQQQLVAVRTVLGIKLKKLQANKSVNQTVNHSKEEIDYRLDQLKEFITKDWDAYFNPETGTSLIQIKSAIHNIEKLDLTKGQGKYELLKIGDSVITKTNDYLMEIYSDLFSRFEVYQRTTFELCENLLHDKKIKQNSPTIQMFDLLKSNLLSNQIFEAKIPTKGVMQLLMSLRRAPMYLFMFISMFAMAGIPMQNIRSNPLFQIAIFSIIILGGIYSWYNNAEEKKNAIEEQTEKAKKAFYQASQKACNQFLQVCLDRFLLESKIAIQSQLDKINLQLKKDEVKKAKQKLKEQRFFEEAIRAKTIQEKQIEQALRQIENIVQKKSRTLPVKNRIALSKNRNNEINNRVNKTITYSSKN